MKILVTGASGLLGRSLMAELAPLAGSADALIGTAHSRLKAPLRRLDLTDEAAVRAAFAEWSPDLVVHSAAERRPDVVDGDPASAERLNVDATRLLAELAAAQARASFISRPTMSSTAQSPPIPLTPRPHRSTPTGG